MTIKRSDKIFSKVITAGLSFSTTALTEANAAAQFLAQEDIEIVGVILTGEIQSQSQNDGIASCAAELSQVATWGQDGTIAVGRVMEVWNTAPAFGQIKDEHVYVMFPAGERMVIKEEGNVYLNIVAAGKTAGTTVVGWQGTIFYKKLGHTYS